MGRACEVADFVGFASSLDWGFSLSVSPFGSLVHPFAQESHTLSLPSNQVKFHLFSCTYTTKRNSVASTGWLFKCFYFLKIWLTFNYKLCL